MGITFTRAWEDDRLDAELLAVGPGERALVIAGAGDTALALAAGGGSIIGVDRNPDQIHLAALKLAAAMTIPAERLHAWFEVGRDPAARTAYRDVRAALPAGHAAWWDRRIGLLESGLHEASGVGRPFAWLGRLARLLVPELAREVERFSDPERQVAWWRSRIAPRLFGRPTHWLLAHTPVLGPLAPNHNERVRMRAGRWSHGLVGRIDAVVATNLVREHPWWRPLTSGRAADPGHGAAWLDPDRLTTLVRNATGLAFVHDDLQRALDAEPAGSLSAISLSNVPDWLPPGAERSLAVAARRALAPGGRLLVRRVVRAAGTDLFAAAGLERDAASDALPARDRTALYEAVDLYRAP